MKKRNIAKIKQNQGFTMIEIIVVVVILAIAAMIAIPTLSSAADMQVRSAANMIAADLDYTRGLAVTRQKNYSVVFTPGSESYEIRDTASNAVIPNPLRGGQNFAVSIANDSRISNVNIATADFDGSADNAVTFDYLGAPYSGLGTGSPMNTGRITLQAGAFTLYVDIEPVTGSVSISSP